MKSDVLYIGILLLIMILVFIGDIKLINYLDRAQKKVVHHVKRTTRFVRKSLTKRQKPENKPNGPSFEDGV